MKMKITKVQVYLGDKVGTEDEEIYTESIGIEVLRIDEEPGFTIGVFPENTPLNPDIVTAATQAVRLLYPEYLRSR